MMSEETAQRIAVALERIADRLERGQGAGGVPAALMPGERVFLSGMFVPGGGFVTGAIPPDMVSGTGTVGAFRPWGGGDGA